MADLTKLEATIAKLNATIDEARTATREGHELLRGLRDERRAIEKLLAVRAPQLVDDRIDEIVKRELDKLGPELAKQSQRVYDTVQRNIDRLIDLALGKDYATSHDRQDIRPQLASKLRQWIREVVLDEGGPRLVPVCLGCGTDLGGASSVNTDDPPAEGAVSICAYCGHIAIFTGDGCELREPTDDERTRMELEPEVRKIRAAARKANLGG